MSRRKRKNAGSARIRRKRRALIVAQGNRCAFCFQPFRDHLKGVHPMAPSLDHVWPRCEGHALDRNSIAVHVRCNLKKKDRPPNGCELIALEWVNAKLDASTNTPSL